jgi:hypothetical protein
MADSVQLPQAGTWPPKTPADAVAWFRFFRSLLDTIATSSNSAAAIAALDARIAALEGDEADPSLLGPYSVKVFGDIATGASVQLENDNATPDPLHFYGTDVDGAKGWQAFADGLLAGTGIDLSVDGATGEVTVNLANLADAGGGSFKLITRDAQGRISGSSDGAAEDIPYDNATSGLTATDLQGAVDELAAGAGGGGAWTVVSKPATTTRVSTIVLADDPHLVIPLIGGEVYVVRARIWFNTANANMDYQFAFAYTGTMPNQPRWAVAAAPGGVGAMTAGMSQAGTATNSFNVATSGLGYAYYDFVLSPSTSGNFTYQWAQRVSDAANCQTLQGSYIEYRKIA